MKRYFGKRGLSPVIASVLLILLVLVLAVIIFLWARGFIGEQIEKFGKPIEDYCSQSNFDVSINGNYLEIRNSGNVDINHFDIKKVRGGDSEISKFDFQVDAGEVVTGYFSLNMEDGYDPEEIILYPALVGNVKGDDAKSAFTCINDGTTLTL